MLKGFFNVPVPVNEPVNTYAPGTKARTLLEAAIAEARAREVDVPMYIGGKEVRTEAKVVLTPPHDHRHVLGYYHKGSRNHVEAGIHAALAARASWENLSWEQRAAICLRSAELISTKSRYNIEAATMLGQSTNASPAAIDCACELADFLRFNVAYM